MSGLSAETLALGPDRLNLLVNDIRNHVSGNIVSSDLTPELLAAAERYESLQTTSSLLLAVLALSVFFIIGGHAVI